MTLMQVSPIRQKTAVGLFLAWAFAAINGVNFKTHRFRLAWSTSTHRSATISSNSR